MDFFGNFSFKFFGIFLEIPQNLFANFTDFLEELRRRLSLKKVLRILLNFSQEILSFYVTICKNFCYKKIIFIFYLSLTIQLSENTKC